MADYDYGQLIDDFELGVDVMPDEDLTTYIERRRREFESKADGGAIGIEILFQDKMANGGRAGYVSGGAALKLLEKGKEGIASLYNAGKSIFSKGDDVVDIAKQEEIFRSGNITTDFLENVDDKVIKKFVATRDAKGPGGYGLYDSFDDMPNGLKAAELISRIKNAEGGINYEAAELFIGKKLKGNETVDELISMVVTEKKADGGRVGLFMGGDPLTGQALSIYDSMKAYNFSDQEIANALSAQGLYTAGGTTDTPDTTIQPIGFQSGNGGGGGGGGITELDPLNRPKGTPFDLNSLTKTKFGYNNALGRTIEGVKDFTGSMIDKFSGSKIGEGITSGATKFKNMAFTPMMALMQKRNPLNPSATNYNPNLQKQMDFLEGTTGTRVFGTSDNLQFEDAAMIGRDPNSGLAKYGPGSVLSGQNVVSGFGTNDYEQQLANYISKMRNYTNLTNFQKEKLEQAKVEVAKEIARREQETADRARAANPGVYASADRQGFTDGKGGGFGSKSTGTNDAFGNKSGRGRTGYSEGGLATMFTRRR